MKRQYLTKKKLPDAPGVYFFKKGRDILYIGKATSLRDRVKSYFSNDLIKTRGRLIVDMVTTATTLDFIKTDSVLEAFILESEEIKKHMPRFNTKEKDNKSFNYVVMTDEDFSRVLVVRGRNLEKDAVDFTYKYVFGPYPYGGELKEAMRLIRKIFPFRDSGCYPLQGRPCFNRSIGLCPGVCTGEITKKEYRKTINHLRLFFQGKKSQLMTVLKKEMKTYAKEQKFEQANDIKRTLLALTHIQDVSLIKKDRFSPYTMKDVTVEPVYEDREISTYRTEAYDIAHLSGTDMVGVMTVMIDGEFDKASYRTFIIRDVEKSNDVAALKEVFSRRLTHPEWSLPDMVIVDGGKAQLTMMRNVIQEMAEVFGTNERSLPVVVAVVKDDRHKAREILSSDEEEIVATERAREIISLNAECHRFALATHRKKRSSSRGLKRRFKK
ncbi:MAG: hypothetical protein V4664_00825 [Patescibacteria group bacterium]